MMHSSGASQHLSMQGLLAIVNIKASSPRAARAVQHDAFGEALRRILI